MTPSFLTTFKLLIFTLFNLSLLISTLIARKMFEILKVVYKQNAIATMHLDWLCSISNMLVGFSQSLIDGLERWIKVKCKKYKFMKIRWWDWWSSYKCHINQTLTHFQDVLYCMPLYGLSTFQHLIILQCYSFQTLFIWIETYFITPLKCCTCSCSNSPLQKLNEGKLFGSLCKPSSTQQ